MRAASSRCVVRVAPRPAARALRLPQQWHQYQPQYQPQWLVQTLQMRPLQHVQLPVVTPSWARAFASRAGNEKVPAEPSSKTGSATNNTTTTTTTTTTPIITTSIEDEIVPEPLPPPVPPVPRLSKEPLAWLKTVPGRFVTEMKHYYHGTRLLGLEIKISIGVLRRILNGKQLTRRERRQLMRTFTDLLRVIPFAVFILIPFMELLLPVALKLFPGMLPSTFEDKHKKEEDSKRRLAARINLAKFLQETAVKLTKDRSEETEEQWDDFLSRVQSGKEVTHDEVVTFAKSFKDEYTLDHVSRAQLLAMCKYMDVPPYGRDSVLRLQLSLKLRQLKMDDRAIRDEGVESLSVPELRAALRARGMAARSNSKAVLRRRLEEWLNLSLDHKLPESLLILSRAFLITEKEQLRDALKETISSLPEELVEEVMLDTGMKVPSSEKARILREQEELIEEDIESEAEEEEEKEKEKERLREQQQREEQLVSAAIEAEKLTFEKATASASAESTADVEDLIRRVAQKVLELSNESAISLEREAVDKMKATASAKEAEKTDELNLAVETAANEATASSRAEAVNAASIQAEISSSARGEPASAPAAALTETIAEPVGFEDEVTRKAKQEIESKANTEWEAKLKAEDEAKAKAEAKAEEKAKDEQTSKRLSNRVDAMIERLEGELTEVEAKIGEAFHVIDKDKDGVITTSELEQVALSMRDKLTPEQIAMVMDRLDTDKDGRIVLNELKSFMNLHVNDYDEDSESNSDSAAESTEMVIDDGSAAAAAGKAADTAAAQKATKRK